MAVCNILLKQIIGEVNVITHMSHLPCVSRAEEMEVSTEVMWHVQLMQMPYCLTSSKLQHISYLSSLSSTGLKSKIVEGHVK